MSQSWQYPGSRWWKFDFHTHTPASRDTPWHSLAETANALTPDAWLLKYMAAEIDCVAVTDHNSGAWIDQLKSAYLAMKQDPPDGFRELHIFPGVEISVNGGFHLLAIFDLDVTTSDIDTLLGAVKYNGTKGDSDGVTRESAPEVIKAILDAKGLVIPAHADSDKGLLQLADPGSSRSQIDPNTVAQILELKAIHAMEFVNPDTAKPSIYTERKLNWTEVLGSDCHNFRTPYPNIPGSRYTWVKMAKPSLEGLRLALLDGNGVSIRRSDDAVFDPFKTPEHFVTTISIRDARVMGRNRATELHFSPYFNAIVGGRGTGKSTIVHALRLASGRKGEIDRLDERSEPRQTFEQFVKVSRNRDDRGGLQEGTSISLEYSRDLVLHRLTWQQRTAKTIEIEEFENGLWKKSLSQEVSHQRFPLRIFSQGQIAAMAGDNTLALLGVIDEAAHTQTLKNNFEELKRNYFAKRASLRQLDGKLQRHTEVIRLLLDVERKLKSFELADHADILRSYQRAGQQNQQILERLKEAAKVKEKLLVLKEEISLPPLTESIFEASTDTDILESMQVLTEIVEATRGRIEESADQLAIDLEELSRQPNILSWKARIESANQAYENLKIELLAQGVNDPSEYARLVQERQTLDAESKKLDLLRLEYDRHTSECELLLRELVEKRNEISTTRSNFLAQILSENEFVRIELIPFGEDARQVERSLREMLDVTDERFASDILDTEGDSGGAGLVVELLSQGGRESGLAAIKQRLIDGCSGAGPLGARFKSFLQKKSETHPEFIDHIRCWFPEDGLQVKYSRKGDGADFQPIGQASAGQRAAAMLAFLLAQSAEPIILDQPEDDLDNHLIYDLVVRQIRENKMRRQLIVVTHNPNIVVNGDAEMLYVFDFNGQCFVSVSGSLQEQNVRDEICRVMEGGREAFSRRWHRLGM